MARVVEAGRVMVGERDLVVAKPTLKVSRQAEEVLGRISAFGGGRAYELRALQVEVLLLMLQPATPDLTAEAIESEVLGEEIDALFGQVLEVAGYKARTAPGEAPRP